MSKIKKKVVFELQGLSVERVRLGDGTTVDGLDVSYAMYHLDAGDGNRIENLNSVELNQFADLIAEALTLEECRV